ncbi:predicted protein [Nematostella vectensis]|uniref:Uncharacterized protein n=1 Tax=Nematostella vectensis TaxID=45351 RepID=A7SMR6_NEMVE|nr:predicted protein [Nematostella vectensis]|eukprot:XP_001627135.1 predicted protein [Nematostella vectensis]
MPREKKCPGCKKPVNDHDFGVPGKHCDGPGGVPEIRGNSTTRNDELLNSLASAVQTLTAEVQSLKADHASSRQSHSLPPSDVASSSRSSKDVSPRRATTVTLPELRAMDDLADAADRRVAHVLPIASSESDEEADMGALASSPLRKPNKAGDANVGEKEKEKVLKYQDIRREIARIWDIKTCVVPIVVGALGTVSKNLTKHLSSIGLKTRIELLQKGALLGSARLLRQIR